MRYGDIELSSGRWKWTVTELGDTEGSVAGVRRARGADPDRREGGPRVLLLEDPVDPDHWMTRQVPRRAAEEPIAYEELKALAADPDRRTVRDRQGTVWRIEPIDRPAASREEADFERAPRKVKASADGGQERTLALPDERPLGSMSREELIRLLHR